MPQADQRRRILIGITGGIAAYRSLELIRLVVKSGGEVRTILTQHAEEFVTRLSVEALSGNPVNVGLFERRSESSIDHIDLARWADVLAVAPATANIIAKFASGIADDLLSTVYLAVRSDCQVVLAPAMNTRMWEHPTVQRNLEQIRRDLGSRLVVAEPQEKLLACGDVGMGAMAEPQDIFAKFPL